MQPHFTARLYLQDAYCFEAGATIIAVRDDSLAFDRTCFYPGGGGQPPDEGFVRLQRGEQLAIISVGAGIDGILWHIVESPPPDILGQPVLLVLNRERRLALMRYHTALHILNTITLRDHGGWITGVQIGTEHSRIDFKLADFSQALAAELERKVNAVLEENHAVKSFYIPEQEFRRRDDLLRTLEAQPPVIDGEVRVVEIEGFDAQACGGTHVHTTSEVGKFSITRTENKGKINKRLYVRLGQPPSRT